MYDERFNLVVTLPTEVGLPMGTEYRCWFQFRDGLPNEVAIYHLDDLAVEVTTPCA